MLRSVELGHKLQTLCVCYINLSLALVVNKLFEITSVASCFVFSVILSDGNFDRRDVAGRTMEKWWCTYLQER